MFKSGASPSLSSFGSTMAPSLFGGSPSLGIPGSSTEFSGHTSHSTITSFSSSRPGFSFETQGPATSQPSCLFYNSASIADTSASVTPSSGTANFFYSSQAFPFAPATTITPTSTTVSSATTLPPTPAGNSSSSGFSGFKMPSTPPVTPSSVFAMTYSLQPKVSASRFGHTSHSTSSSFSSSRRGFSFGTPGSAASQPSCLFSNSASTAATSASTTPSSGAANFVYSLEPSMRLSRLTPATTITPTSTTASSATTVPPTAAENSSSSGFKMPSTPQATPSSVSATTSSLQPTVSASGFGVGWGPLSLHTTSSLKSSLSFGAPGSSATPHSSPLPSTESTAVTSAATTPTVSASKFGECLPKLEQSTSFPSIVFGEQPIGSKNSVDFVIPRQLLELPVFQDAMHDFKEVLRSRTFKRLLALSNDKPTAQMGFEIADSIDLLKILNASDPVLETIGAKAREGASILQEAAFEMARGEGLLGDVCNKISDCLQ